VNKMFIYFFCYLKGYTCLHLASIFNRNELMPILKQYGAQSTPDYSGKLGMDYSISNSFNDLIQNG
jgi:hypothetical protein